MIAAVVPIAAEALDAATMSALAEREWGAGAAARPAPPGPALVAHVVASNVPALALPAIALGCLAGAAVLVKSGRDDPLSAPAFQRALAAVDPALAATVVTAYWPGGEVAREDAALGRAEVGWAPGAAVLGGAGGTVIYEDAPAFRPTAGRRTVRVHPLCDARELVELLPTGEIECVGVAGIDPAPLVAALRARGVARVCPVGRMQRPPLSWPRGQHAPLGALLGRRAEPLLEVEP